MIARRSILSGLGLTMALALAACAGTAGDRPPPEPLDIDALTDITAETAIALVNNWAEADAVLIARDLIGLDQARLIKALVPEILADLTLFGPEATARPKDVRIVVLGRDVPDTVVSQRATALYKVLARSLGVGALERRAVTELVLLSQLAGAVTRALDAKRRIQGGTFTMVLDGLFYDGAALQRDL